LEWRSVGSEKDLYITDLSLEITDTETKLPVYYVMIKATNGAGIPSLPVVSTPILVVDEDKPGNM